MDFKQYIDSYAQNDKVFWACGIPWRNYKSVLQPLSLPHVETNFHSDKIKKMLKKSKTPIAMWTYDFDSTESNWWWIIKEKPYSFESLRRKTRYNIRHGLTMCEVKIISAKLLAEIGYSCYKSAMSRHYQTQPIDEETFKKNIPLYDYNKAYEIWGIFKNNILVGYGIYIIIENVVNQQDAIFDPEYFRFHSSYALIHSISDYYLNQKDYLYITTGMRSINHRTQFEEFVIKNFKYRKAYCKLGIETSLLFGIIFDIIYYSKPVWEKFYLSKNLTNKMFIIYELMKIRRRQT